MTDLLLSRGSTKYKEQVQKLLESQPAVKKDRAGELALGNSFLGLPGRGVVSRLGVQGRLKNRGGGRSEMARGGRLRPERRGRPGNSKNATLPARESFFFHFLSGFFFLHCFCIFCIFFAFPRLGVIFCIFFACPRPGVIFWAFFFCISQTGSLFPHLPGEGC